ncbi:MULTISPECIES: FAD/NAD(P)-binding oxidoreductase [Actinomycetes]|uniref:FAD-dependent oxidoreductase n=1 Tax=Actinomycetes TaxID=1760 RepID=UPI0018CC76F7|nr:MULTISPECIES: FAD/NAD(P)-binding oxidoreductase [Actinomycetes]
MTPAASTADQHYDVLVIGGGNAGISAAARLIKKGITDVAVIEPQRVHTYRPLLSYVGGGQATLNDAERTQRSVTPEQCTWVQDTAISVDAPSQTVLCASGRITDTATWFSGPVSSRMVTRCPGSRRLSNPLLSPAITSTGPRRPGSWSRRCPLADGPCSPCLAHR